MTRLSGFFWSLFLVSLVASCNSPGDKSAVDASPARSDAARAADTAADVTATGPDVVPASSDSRATDMAPAKTDVTSPNASAPDATRADAMNADTFIPPDTAKADAVNADTFIPPDTAKADAGIPDGARPDAAKADAGIPDSAQPEAAKADAGIPETVAPDGPAVAACVQAALTHLSPLELKTLLDSGEDPFLINVKGDSIESIPGTDAVLANDIPGIETLVNHDTCANIVLYCRTGVTSQSVGSELIARGYKRVRDLAGGITAWQAAGYPTL
jgi:phage shock protein E